MFSAYLVAAVHKLSRHNGFRDQQWLLRMATVSFLPLPSNTDCGGDRDITGPKTRTWQVLARVGNEPETTW